MAVSDRARRLHNIFTDASRVLRSDPRFGSLVNVLAPFAREPEPCDRLLSIIDKHASALLAILAEPPPPPSAPVVPAPVVEPPESVRAMEQLIKLLPEADSITAKQLERLAADQEPLRTALSIVTGSNHPFPALIDRALATRTGKTYAGKRVARVDEAPAAVAGFTARQFQWQVVADPAA